MNRNTLINGKLRDFYLDLFQYIGMNIIEMKSKKHISIDSKNIKLINL